MKTWPIIGFSFLLNAILAAAIVLSFKKTAPPAPATPMAAAPASSPIPSSPAAESSPSAGQPFQWSRIASDNLKIYRDNLRAIGCPELTVREIIRAVINENLGTRRRDILDSFQEKYWDRVLRGEQVRRQWLPRTEWGLALTSLAAERQQQISDVLGPDALTTEAGRQAQQADGEQKLSWLPPEKRAQLVALQEKYRQQLARMGRHPGFPTRRSTDVGGRRRPSEITAEV